MSSCQLIESGIKLGCKRRIVLLQLCFSHVVPSSFLVIPSGQLIDG